MKKSLPVVLAACGLIGLSFAGMAMANSAVDDDWPAMMVSPSTIVLAKVSVVTVHTNIDASEVVADSIYLDDAASTKLGVDSLGHLVAKFAVADLGLEPGDATLTLSGDFKDGRSFSASDGVTVK
jgi:hypothetical protein